MNNTNAYDYHSELLMESYFGVKTCVDSAVCIRIRKECLVEGGRTRSMDIHSLGRLFESDPCMVGSGRYPGVS